MNLVSFVQLGKTILYLERGDIEMNIDYDINKLHRIPQGTKFICMFSGGKDSGLSLVKAMQMGQVVALIHILINDRSLYHKQEKKVLDAQAQAMDIPVEYINFKWWRDRKSAVELLLRYKSMGVEAVVFGDIYLKYIIKGHIPLCEQVGLLPCAPICGQPYELLIEEIESNKLISIITQINHLEINKKWLGHPYDRQVFEYLKTLKLDAFGENGEFHTTLVNGDCFKKKLRYTLERDGDYNFRLIMVD
jgi:uncharacterized protein (TIGR00290 family)